MEMSDAAVMIPMGWAVAWLFGSDTWKIREGAFDGTRLDGLCIALILGFLAVLLKHDENERPRSHEFLGRHLRGRPSFDRINPKISADAVMTGKIRRFMMVLLLAVGGRSLALAMEHALRLVHWRSLRESAHRRSDDVVRCSTVIDKPECVAMFNDVSDAQQKLWLK
jgi:hypothetical protein